MVELKTYLYECEFSFYFDAIYYKSFKIHIPLRCCTRDFADKLVSLLFSDNEYFVGAKLIARF